MAGITINQLRKTYDKGRTLALDDISLHIHPGELFGIIGPDGAGKTSLLRILATLLLPDSGSCQPPLAPPEQLEHLLHHVVAQDVVPACREGGGGHGASS
jgi:ABC-type multidrug transport system ATPase subunit